MAASGGMGTTTVAGFGKETTGREVAARFATGIRGKVVLITGVSPNSIGASLAQTICLHSPSHLILASRTRSKLTTVASTLSISSATTLSLISVDFSSLTSVRRAAGEITALLAKGKQQQYIDILFNNAGINIRERRVTDEGVELQWATNHLGPWLFTNLLLPLMRKEEGGGGRVVMTSSEAHRISPVRFSDIGQEPGRRVPLPADEGPRRGLAKGILKDDGGYEPGIAYGQSKTANILFAVALNRRFADRGLKSFAVMPGTIMTNIVDGLEKENLDALLQYEEWKTQDQGTATMLMAGLDPVLDVKSGVYLDNCQFRKASNWASNPEKAERLWKLSEDMAGQKFTWEEKSRL